MFRSRPKCILLEILQFLGRPFRKQHKLRPLSNHIIVIVKQLLTSTSESFCSYQTF